MLSLRGIVVRFALLRLSQLLFKIKDDFVVIIIIIIIIILYFAAEISSCEGNKA